MSGLRRREVRLIQRGRVQPRDKYGPDGTRRGGPDLRWATGSGSRPRTRLRGRAPLVAVVEPTDPRSGVHNRWPRLVKPGCASTSRPRAGAPASASGSASSTRSRISSTSGPARPLPRRAPEPLRPTPCLGHPEPVRPENAEAPEITQDPLECEVAAADSLVVPPRWASIAGRPPARGPCPAPPARWQNPFAERVIGSNPPRMSGQHHRLERAAPPETPRRLLRALPPLAVPPLARHGLPRASACARARARGCGGASRSGFRDGQGRAALTHHAATTSRRRRRLHSTASEVLLGRAHELRSVA